MTIQIYRPPFPILEESTIPNILENYQYGSDPSQLFDFSSFENIKDVDFILLPSTWHFYLDSKKIILAQKIINQFESYHKKYIIFSSGDYTVDNSFNNCVIIQSSAFKSRDGLNGNKLLALPAFIDDYLNLYCQGNIAFRKYKKKPVVGFCGQSNGNWLDYTRRRAHIIDLNLRYKLGLVKWEPPKIEPTRFRFKILQNIASSDKLEANFILRTKYRAGYTPQIKDPYHSTRLEFVNNIIDSDYTVCVRGGGNFSVRFYETLALGRIPIFVNTDCVLPFDEMINYKEYMVWVEEDELAFINQKILDFHNSLNQTKFNELQRACRNLWETYLTRDGFFIHLADQLKALIGQ